ncbi:SpoIIE family protein phosphatase [Streptomyces sp. Act143]|uniref:SpoIIE family protein phosphatase n=1 Tax=Streptomyces sp. Act143 TaxID=2200760 RepID=UPI0011B54B43|nr:SpoIIE family protein phosphatase [Streptomyces sp. Act143]
MTLLAVAPALGLCLPPHRRLPLFAGGMAFGGALALGSLEWRDRPFVVVGTLVNITLVTLAMRRIERRGQDIERPVSSESTPAIAPAQPDPLRTWSSRVGDVRVEARVVPAPGQDRLRRVSYDLRPTRFGPRLLVAASPHGEAHPEETAAHLLHHWAKTAEEESSLAEAARRLDAAVSAEREGSDRGVSALLVSLASDTAAEVICCGRASPLLMAEDKVQPLNVLAPLPALGRFTSHRADVPIYTTAVRLTAGRRLLLHMNAPLERDREGGDGHPLVDVLRAQADGLATLAPDACLGRLSTRLAECAEEGAGGEVVLMAVEREPQAAQSYVPTRGDASGEEHLKVG